MRVSHLRQGQFFQFLALIFVFRCAFSVPLSFFGEASRWWLLRFDAIALVLWFAMLTMSGIGVNG